MGNNKHARSFSAWGKICTGVLCAAIAVALAGDVSDGLKAQGSSVGGLQEQLAKLQQENAERDKKIKELGANIDENKEAMDLVSSQIDGITEELDNYSAQVAAKKQEIDAKGEQISNVEKSIADKEVEIDNKKDEIAELKRQNKENLAKFAKLARAMYMNNTSDKIPVLNGSDDWYDYFVYSDVVRNISGQNAKFMQELMDSIKDQENKIQALNDDISALDAEKDRLSEEKKKVENEMAELVEEQEKIESYSNERKNYLYGLVANNDALKKKVDNLEYENEISWQKMDEINAEIERIIRESNAGDDPPSTSASGDYIWPLDTRFQYITTYFGYDAWRNGMHRGIDIGNAGIANANVYAAQEGTVIVASNTCSHNYGKNYTCCASYGNYIIVKHPNGYATLYAHLGSLNVSQGQYVSQGQVIGHVGTTGWSTGYHLHFEVRTPDGTRTDPFGYTYSNL